MDNQRFEHCQLIGTKIVYLGRDGIFEDKRDNKGNPFSAWDYLEKKGWELVSVVTNKKGESEFYFKKPANLS